MSEDPRIDMLAGHLNLIIRALLVAGRQGAPAEGKIPFNPLYFNILRVLDSDGPSRPSHLADVLGVSRTTVSTATRALANRSLLTSVPDPSDGRAQRVDMTVEGRDVLTSILRQDRRNAAAMLAALDDAEMDAFLAATGKVAAAVSGETAKG